MNENYKRMMNQVKLSPEKRNEIAEKLSAEPQKNERKTLRFPVKAILVAAAVCVMLIGTVIAAEYFEKRIELGEQSSTTEQASYEIVPDIKPWTLDQLSEILRIDLENGTIERIFNDKAELEKYLGIELIDSTALEKAVIIDDLESSIEYGWNEREETLLDPNARYIVSTTDLDNKFTDTDPSVIKITSHRVMRNSEILIDARIITENTTIDELKAGVFGENFRPKTMLKHEWILDENRNIKLGSNGNPLAITTPYLSAEHKFVTYPTYKMANGCEATIIKAIQFEEDGTEDFEEFMGYFIHNNILYTVKPDAIYDPSYSFPMNDYDMLTVLYDVLDTFE